MNYKKIVFGGMLLLAAAFTSKAQVRADAPQELLQIKESHDFGAIRKGRPVTYAFSFQNTGSEPIKLENVAASCGCTTPIWSPAPIGPGQSGSITVGYNAAVEGPFEKSVTIIYNGGKTKTIYVKGMVEKPTPTLPPNSSVQLLRQSN